MRQDPRDLDGPTVYLNSRSDAFFCSAQPEPELGPETEPEPVHVQVRTPVQAQNNVWLGLLHGRPDQEITEHHTRSRRLVRLPSRYQAHQVGQKLQM